MLIFKFEGNNCSAQNNGKEPNKFKSKHTRYCRTETFSSLCIIHAVMWFIESSDHEQMLYMLKSLTQKLLALAEQSTTTSAANTNSREHPRSIMRFSFEAKTTNEFPPFICNFYICFHNKYFVDVAIINVNMDVGVYARLPLVDQNARKRILCAVHNQAICSIVPSVFLSPIIMIATRTYPYIYSCMAEEKEKIKIYSDYIHHI